MTVRAIGSQLNRRRERAKRMFLLPADQVHVTTFQSIVAFMALYTISFTRRVLCAPANMLGMEMCLVLEFVVQGSQQGPYTTKPLNPENAYFAPTFFSLPLHSCARAHRGAAKHKQ